MYKILNLKGLGVAGRQNELIELALTHGFKGVEIDMTDLVGRHDALGKEFACQFLQSANMDIGSFDLPIDFGGTDEEFVKSCESLETIMDLAQTLNAKRCRIRVQPNSESVSFNENQDRHRERIEDIAARMEGHGIKVGLYLQASKAVEADGNYKFVQTAEEIMKLCKDIGHDNVGLSIDIFEWLAGSGGLDQISELDPKSIVEVIYSDMSAEATPGSLKKEDRVLPSTGADPFSYKLAQHILSGSIECGVSMGTDTHFFTGPNNRHKVVAHLSVLLDKLIAGEEPVIVEEVPEVEGEEGAEEGDDKKETTGDAKVDAKPKADAKEEAAGKADADGKADAEPKGDAKEETAEAKA